MSVITLSYKVEGFLTIYDPNSGEVLVDKHNAINYETMSEAIADTLSSRGYGEIYHSKNGWDATRHGAGKGGGRKKKEKISGN